MNLPEPAAEVAKWTLLVGLAFFSADATSALIGRGLEMPEKPLPQTAVGAVLEEVPAQAVPPGLVDLLQTTEPEAVVPDDETLEKNDELRPAPTTQLNQLRLRGTMAGGGGAGLAMIDLQGQTQVVGTGEQIAGMTVAQVTTYSVTLESGQQTFLLEMDSTSQGAPAPLARPRPVVQQPEPSPVQEEPEEEEEEDPEPIHSMDQLRNIMDNPEGFMDGSFSAKPVLRDGQVQGMKVSVRKPTHPLARLGIKNGDIVKSLNGTPLEGPESLSTIYRTLRNSSTLRFEVERDGNPETVEITLD